MKKPVQEHNLDIESNTADVKPANPPLKANETADYMTHPELVTGFKTENEVDGEYKVYDVIGPLVFSQKSEVEI